MAFYEITLTGGERAERYEFATEFDLKAADHTGHQVVFHREHPATRQRLQSAYQSAAGDRFRVQVKEITEAVFRRA